MVLRLSDCSDGLVGDDRMDWYSIHFHKRMEGGMDEDNDQLLYTVHKLQKIQYTKYKDKRRNVIYSNII